MKEELRELKLEIQNLGHQMAAGFERVEKRLDEHDERFDRLEKEMRDGFAYVAESMSVLMRLPAKVDGIEVDIAEIKPYFLALKTPA